MEAQLQKDTKKKFNNIIGGWITFLVIAVGFSGLMTYFAIVQPPITLDGVTAIEVQFDRLTRHVSRGNYSDAISYRIYAIDDDTNFRITSIASIAENYFLAEKFERAVSRGDTIRLIIRSLDCPNDRGGMVFSVYFNGTYFLDFDSAFNAYNRNNQFTVIARWISYPLIGILTIAFIIHIVIFKKSQKNSISLGDAQKSENILNEKNLIDASDKDIWRDGWD
ncbi:MAG: hypothetical protein FWE13_04980 [Firmicutes bacterium]|nr:hypothetical protein [Bacillota bacterium]